LRQSIVAEVSFMQ